MTKTKDNLDWWQEYGEPIPVKDGIKAHAQSGSFTRNWWAKRWLQALVQVMDPNRLSRGRQYARAGQVISLEVQPGLVLAQVQGTRPRPYRQRIELHQFSDAEWDRALTQLASQALFSAQLLNGEMPQNIEEAFESASLYLFPNAASDITMSCTCPDWVRPCKHLAAILLLLGESLDSDPFLLFVMRGRNREQLMSALRDHRAAYAVGGAAPSGDSNHIGSALLKEGSDTEAANFWRLGDTRAIQFHVSGPEVEMEVYKMLGDPSFTDEKNLADRLATVYRLVTAKALEVAFAAHGEGTNNPTTESDSLDDDREMS